MSARPLAYRSDVLAPTLSAIIAGECCSIVGISGVGKSNVVQQLLSPEVRSYHAPQTNDLQVVPIDANLLVRWSDWGLFEGLLNALLQLRDLVLPEVERVALSAAHAEILRTPANAPLAFRQCAAAVEAVCQQQRLVLLFDEFDPLLAALDAQTLRQLRGLRDQHKYRLVFVTLTREPLSDVCAAEWDDMEPFLELFSLHQIGLGPLMLDDAEAEAERFAGRHGAVLTAGNRALAVEQSGGHPALLRALVQLSVAGAALPGRGADDLLKAPSVQQECAKIWQQCTGREQETLIRLLSGGWLSEEELDDVRLKGLTTDDGTGGKRIFSPLFAAYIRQRRGSPAPAGEPVLSINPEKQRVMYYGRDITKKIGGLQYQLLLYLWERPGRICSVEETSRHLHGQALPHDLGRVRILAGRLVRGLSALVPGRVAPVEIIPRRGYLYTPSPEDALFAQGGSRT